MIDKSKNIDLQNDSLIIITDRADDETRHFSMFKGGDTTEAKNNTVNEFMYCYQLITYLGHRKASK